MSQTRGRNAGYREKSNSREPYHLSKSNFSSRNRTSSRSPSNEPPATASIIKTRAFQFLVNAVGAENIALALDSTLSRDVELTNGERFTPETAFHMETTLGLPHGFFDQPYPALSPELIARLKSPLEFVRTDDDVDDDAKTLTAQAPAVPVTQEQLFVADGSSEDAQMPSQKAKSPQSTAKTGQSQLAKQSGKASASTASGRRAAIEATAPEQLTLHDGATVESIRRANLHVLTARNGSKAKLGLVMGMTGSNMAHRLHGKKRMDDAEAERFTAGLGLPGGWLDTPRSNADIPESVALLLAPASRVRAPGQAPAPTAAVPDEDTQATAAPTGEIGRARPSSSSDPISEALPADAAGEEDSAASAHNENVSSPSVTRDGRFAERAEPETPASIGAPAESLPAFSMSTPSATPPSDTLGTSLAGLDGIAPIAEALLKTLAGKARTGRLDELTALELLQQAVLL